MNLGEAAHIRAARPGQARFDYKMTDEERSDINNGIWLCKECARKIDLDETSYPVESLHQWKQNHEKLISQGSQNEVVRNSASKPILEDGYATLVQCGPKPNKLCAKIRFLITIPGPNKCNIRDVFLTGSIPQLNVNLVSIGKWPGNGVNVPGTQKLPLVIPTDEPTHVFIHTESSEAAFKKAEFPESLKLNITLNHTSKPLTVLLSKQENGHQYMQ